MIILHTRFFDIISRAMIFALGEKRAHFHIIQEPQFDNSPQLLAIDPIGRVPLLVDNLYGNGGTIKEPIAAFEYIEDILPYPSLYAGGPLERAEIRSLLQEILRAIMPMHEKIMVEKIAKLHFRSGAPDTNILREIRDEIADFLEGTGKNTAISGYAIGGKLTIIDYILAAYISILDYLDLISWEKFKAARNYYRGLKQRPAFAPILGLVYNGINPPAHYKELDF